MQRLKSIDQLIGQLIVTTLIQAVKLPTTTVTRLSSLFEENELKK